MENPNSIFKRIDVVVRKTNSTRDDVFLKIYPKMLNTAHGLAKGSKDCPSSSLVLQYFLTMVQTEQSDMTASNGNFTMRLTFRPSLGDKSADQAEKYAINTQDRFIAAMARRQEEIVFAPGTERFVIDWTDTRQE
jgi:hypothetical protein